MARITFQETEGSHRAYSYDLDPDDLDGEELQLGKWYWDDDDNLPKFLISQSEGLGQSDSCPPFVWDPDGDIVVIVSDSE